MATYKGAKWAQILTLMAAIAASLVSGIAEAKSYADALVGAVAAGDVSFSSENFTADNVEDALEELFTGVGNSAISISTSTTSSGMLRSYTISQGGQSVGVIDIPKDYVNNIIGIVTKDGNNNDGVFLKVNTAPTGADNPVYEYVDVSGLVEYITVGTQTSKPVQLTIDANHQITADIPAGAITSTHLSTAVNTSLGKADTALQDGDFEWATDNEVNTSWATALAAAETAAATPAQEEQNNGGE